MKLIIELSENDYKALKEDGVQNHLALADTVIANSMPYEETPKYFPPCEDCNKKMEEIRQAYDKMKAMERPTGEWIISQTMDCHSDIVNVYTCPFCGKREYSAYPYCHCGARMGAVQNETDNGILDDAVDLIKEIKE